MTGHTPGPWTYDPNTETVDSGATAIAGINVDEWDYNMAQANARLIAAAPELLAAVKELSSSDVEGTVNRERNIRIAALIRRAEGRPEP